MDSTDVVVDYVKSMLEDEDLLAEKRWKENEFYVSDYTTSFEDTAKIFYGEDIELKTINIW